MSLSYAARAMETMREPKGVVAWVRWIRWAYRQEPPVRLHVVALGIDGNPRMSPDFAAWLASIDEYSVACATDEDGRYRTPLRCALFSLHGRFENTDRAAKADYAAALAQTDWLWSEVADAAGIQPDWVKEVATIEALKAVWDMYAPMPRG